MTSKDLKILAGNIVFESEYSDSAKKQLLNFIKEATSYQIKTLILDGKIESIAEDAENIIDKRFDIITENAVSEVVEDTVAFLSIGRETICEFIESQGYEKDQLEEMKNFIMNEASDYQILSVLTDDILPDESSNPVAEAVLFEGLNMAIGTNFMPISEYGISSLNEYTMPPRAVAIMNKIAKVKKSISGLKPGVEGRNDLEQELGYLNKELSQYSKQSLGDKAISGLEKGAVLAKKGYEKGKEVAGVAAEKGKEYVGTAGEKISGVLRNLPSAAAIGGKISAAATSPTGMVIGGLAAATLLGYGAYKIYKNYFSAAAKKCAGSSDKNTCMKQARFAGVKAQIGDLTKGASGCSKSKDPAKCKAVIQNKIAKLRNKLA